MHLSQNWIDYKLLVEAGFGSAVAGLQYGEKLVISRLIEHGSTENGREYVTRPTLSSTYTTALLGYSTAGE